MRTCVGCLWLCIVLKKKNALYVGKYGHLIGQYSTFNRHRTANPSPVPMRTRRGAPNRGRWLEWVSDNLHIYICNSPISSLSDMRRAFWQVLLIALWRRTIGEGEVRAPIITGELIIIHICLSYVWRVYFHAWFIRLALFGDRPLLFNQSNISKFRFFYIFYLRTLLFQNDGVGQSLFIDQGWVIFCFSPSNKYACILALLSFQ